MALLDAVIDSPVRRTVKPVGLPDPAGEELRSAVRRAAGQVPELARLLGLPIPPPPGPRRPQPLRRPGGLSRPPPRRPSPLRRSRRGPGGTPPGPRPAPARPRLRGVPRPPRQRRCPPPGSGQRVGHRDGEVQDDEVIARAHAARPSRAGRPQRTSRPVSSRISRSTAPGQVLTGLHPASRDGPAPRLGVVAPLHQEQCTVARRATAAHRHHRRRRCPGSVQGGQPRVRCMVMRRALKPDASRRFFVAGRPAAR